MVVEQSSVILLASPSFSIKPQMVSFRSQKWHETSTQNRTHWEHSIPWRPWNETGARSRARSLSASANKGSGWSWVVLWLSPRPRLPLFYKTRRQPSWLVMTVRNERPSLKNQQRERANQSKAWPHTIWNLSLIAVPVCSPFLAAPGWFLLRSNRVIHWVQWFM